MRRRDVVLLIGGIAAWLPLAQAQQPAKVARIGYLSSSWPDAPSPSRIGSPKVNSTDCPISPLSLTSARWTSS